ncbi:hypothetical protein MLD38_010967 [Melastoma candidum]|uniref:Uncharacterized protein n=1 Tax=Melastoma candidum TaxID=119954 RepID=A0ACB9R1K5_9MYRT|nr:hypothetical protein MLD38_010967 [Melastoma candidum]
MVPSSLGGVTATPASSFAETSRCRRSSGSSWMRTRRLTTLSCLPSSLNPSPISRFIRSDSRFPRLWAVFLLTSCCIDKSIVDLWEGVDLDTNTLGKEVKAAFGASWKDTPCDSSLVDGEINPGSPAVLVVYASAIRLLELLRGFKPFTRECRLAKLFSRHIKVEEQLSL